MGQKPKRIVAKDDEISQTCCGEKIYAVLEREGDMCTVSWTCPKCGWNASFQGIVGQVPTLDKLLQNGPTKNRETDHGLHPDT